MGKRRKGRPRAPKVILIFTAALLCVCAAAAMLLGCLGLFGFGARIVMSSSMEQSSDAAPYGGRIREIRRGSLIILKLLPTDGPSREAFYAEIRAGDVLTFGYKIAGKAIEVTHRVREIERSGDGYLFVLRGDSGELAGTQVIDTAEDGDRIIGKVAFCSFALGVVVCILRDPLFLTCVCAVFLCVLPFGMRRKGRPKAQKPLHGGGKMKKRIFALLLVLVICCFAFTVGATFALLDEVIPMRNHLTAGSLKVTLVRQKLTTVNIDDSGILKSTVDEADLDFTADTQENIFGLADGTTIVPGSSFTAEMKIKNGGDVAFFYYVEVYFNAIVSDATFASMLKFTAESEKNVRQETLIKDGLTLGDDGTGLGTVIAGGAETFTVRLEFLDDENSNKTEGKFVLFDLRVHAVQMIGTE